MVTIIILIVMFNDDIECNKDIDYEVNNDYFHNVNTTDNDNDVNKVDNSDVYRKRRTKIEVANQTKM